MPCLSGGPSPAACVFACAVKEERSREERGGVLRGVRKEGTGVRRQEVARERMPCLSGAPSPAACVFAYTSRKTGREAECLKRPRAFAPPCPALPPPLSPQAWCAAPLPEPVQQPQRLMRDDHHLIPGRKPLLHHVCKVPVSRWGGGLTEGVTGSHQHWQRAERREGAAEEETTGGVG